MKASSIFVAAGFCLSAIAPGFAAGGSPAGEWLVSEGNAIVRISKCGGGFCGFVAKGEPGKDYRNPDPRKRNRSVVGIQVLFGMRPAGDNSWSGQTYNAEDGQMYNGKITLVSPSSLQIQGCVPGGGACGSRLGRGRANHVCHSQPAVQFGFIVSIRHRC